MGEYVFNKVAGSAVRQAPVIKTETIGKIILASYQGMRSASSKSELGTVKVDTSSVLDEAAQCVENEDYIGALELYDKAIVVNPRDYRTSNYKADTLNEKLGDYVEAIKVYDEAIAINSQNPVAFNHKGDVLGKLERYEEVIRAYDRALEIKPDYFDVLKDKGFVLNKLERYYESINYFDKALKVSPNHRRVLAFRNEVVNKYAKSEKDKAFRFIILQNMKPLNV